MAATKRLNKAKKADSHNAPDAQNKLGGKASGTVWPTHRQRIRRRAGGDRARCFGPPDWLDALCRHACYWPALTMMDASCLDASVADIAALLQ